MRCCYLILVGESPNWAILATRSWSAVCPPRHNVNDRKGLEAKVRCDAVQIKRWLAGLDGSTADKAALMFQQHYLACDIKLMAGKCH
jgi:hypothetical protein